MKEDTTAFRYIVNHAFMPLRLPQAYDQPEEDFSRDYALARAVLASATSFVEAAAKDLPNIGGQSRWIHALKMLDHVGRLHTSQPFSKDEIKHSLSTLGDQDSLVVLIRKQNAGLIFRVERSKVIVEGFTASLPNEEILACHGKILRSLPEVVVSFNIQYLRDEEDVSQLSTVLSQLNAEDAEGAKSQIVRAGSTVDEPRNPPSSKYILDWLLGTLSGLDMDEAPAIRCLEKRTADDVLWRKAYLPWRRSPLWLAIRVGLQLAVGDKEFKAFMVWFLTDLLAQTGDHTFSDDLVSLMRTKLARRAAKSESRYSLPTFVRVRFDEVNARVESSMKHTWENIRRTLDNPIPTVQWQPSILDFGEDTALKLIHSREKLFRIMSRPIGIHKRVAHNPAHPLRLFSEPSFTEVLRKFTSTVRLGYNDADVRRLDLLDFEALVARDLEHWCLQMRDANITESMSPLLAAIQKYHDVAIPLYRGNSEAISQMLLTILELWMAIDQIAVRAIPLLASFPCDILPSILEPLLLRRPSDLRRVSALARYLHTRQPATRSIFASPRADSFSVAYFAQSPALQRKRLLNDEVARQQILKKQAELAKKMATYQTLVAQAQVTAHVHSVVANSTGSGSSVVKAKCPACLLSKKARRTKISVYERPLPSNDVEAQNFIFEGNCPEAFSLWREATYVILSDVFVPTTPPLAPMTWVSLKNYASRQGIVANAPKTRLTLMSTTKSFAMCHYRRVKLPTTPEAVIVNHSLQWSLFDCRSGVSQVSLERLRPPCFTSLIPPLILENSSYEALSFAVQATDHSVNRVLAEQHRCSQSITSHEFIAFGSLRAGPNVQWINLCTELASQVLSFNQGSVHLLLSQLVHQVGTIEASGAFRWHSRLTSVPFCAELLGVMENLLSIVEGNWQELNTIRCLIEISLRLLGSQKDKAIELRLVNLLRSARKALSQWMYDLHRQTSRINETHLASYRRRIIDIALACRQTFDVDAVYFPSVCTSSRDVRDFFAPFLLIHILTLQGHEPTTSPTTASIWPAILAARDFRIAHRWENHMRERCLTDASGLDEALRLLWPQYHASGKSWTAVSAPNSRWLSCLTATNGSIPSQLVHLNLLSGEVLIDGRSMGVLPTEILKSSSYGLLFHDTVLDVVPTYLDGCQYMTREPFHKFQVFFGWQNNRPLIRALPSTSNDLRDLQEFIPEGLFLDDLPWDLSKYCAHWACPSLGIVEFRPLQSAWISSKNNWELLTESFRLQHSLDKAELIDPTSMTFQMLFEKVQNLEDRRWVVMEYTHTSARPISIKLPRFRLSFLYNQEYELPESQDFPGTFIDPDQGIGTLYGLRNKLVLQDKIPGNITAAYPQMRRVIIPHGDVSFATSTTHTVVAVDTKPKTESRASYSVFRVDTELGRLSASQESLESRLFRVYLHAITSRPYPDQLTSRTGIEEALNELYSAACLSFDRLNGREVELLHLIRSLTPIREFYPRGLRSMQSVSWLDLPASVQLSGFNRRVLEILAYNESLRIFCQDDQSLPAIPIRSPNDSPDLQSRAAAREPSQILLKILSTSTAFISPTDLVHPSYQAPKPQVPYYLGTRMAVTLSEPQPYVLNPGAFQLQEWLQTGILPLPLLTETEPLRSLEFSTRFFTISSTGLRDRWLAMLEAAVSSVPLRVKQSRLVFTLSALLYAASVPARVTASYLAAAAKTSMMFSPIVRPEAKAVQLLSKPSASSDLLLALVQKHALSPLNSADAKSMCDSLYGQYSHSVANTLHLTLRVPNRFSTSINSSSLFSEASELFKSWDSIRSIQTFITTAQKNLSLSISLSPPIHLRQFPQRTNQKPRRKQVIHPLRYDLYSLMQSTSPPQFEPLTTPSTLPKPIVSHASYSKAAHSALENVSKMLSNTNLALPCHYAADVLASRTALMNTPSDTITEPVRPTPALTAGDAYSSYIHDYQHFMALFSAIQGAIQPKSEADTRAFAGSLWPCIALRDLLALLTWLYYDKLPPAWRDVLIEISLRLLQAQLSRRLFHVARSGKLDGIYPEPSFLPFPRTLANKHPDWLLIQIESNVLARPNQLSVATEMYRPTQSKNATLQLNMGEGKSSIIVPFVGCSLANGTLLVRTIALKPQMRSMFTILTDRVSSLPNRRVAIFAFSRDILRHGNTVLEQLSSLYSDLVSQRGLLLAQPEHIQSPKLLLIERMVANPPDPKQAATALRLYLQLHSTARDVLDECDEELAVSYQLIYTVGSPIRIEWHPHRWIIIQRILGACIGALVRTPTITLISKNLWIFPHVQCLAQNAVRVVGDRLSRYIGQLLQEDRLYGIGLGHLSQWRRRVVVEFVSQRHPSRKSIRLVDDQPYHLRNALLVLRGLLAFDILAYCLTERRWRVDYGLDPTRSAVAVPFTANDVPSAASEFAHPDLTIILTCLAYYYQGLTDKQVKDSLAHLLSLSNPMVHYTRWLKLVPSSSLPATSTLRHVAGLNLDDSDHLETVTGFLRGNRQTINFYLREFIFPKAAKTFPHKLQTSGWDLAEERAHSVTGFSGTKDNHHLLPLSIRFVDPAAQGGTNAMVLLNVLDPRNSRYEKISHRPGGKDIIEKILGMSVNIRVLLDIGAQVLDMTNRQVAEHWLGRSTSDREAAIYFDQNELTVIRRDGTTEPFQSSTYKEQTKKCLVYLDDAHTRGTDLSLPRGFQAVVTLGRKVTKDKLVQGCMRMRQLGSGQTLAFLAPLEVDYAIRQASKKSEQDKITVNDIVLWTMLETCRDIEHHASAWAAQGLDYTLRRKALDGLCVSPLDRNLHATLRTSWLQKEDRTLHNMYHPRVTDQTLARALKNPSLKARLSQLGVTDTTIRSNYVDEEQERAQEVSHEVEAEPEVARPLPLVLSIPSVHPDVLALATTGSYMESSSAFLTIDQYFQMHLANRWTHLKQTGAQIFSREIMLTQDFARTLDGTYSADFMSPVRWVLRCQPFSASKGVTLVILSQFEADHLLPLLHSPKIAQIHAYAAKVTPTMRAFDSLNFCSVPPGSVAATRLPAFILAQLNLFAGQLYPSSYNDYLSLAEFLGIDPTRVCRRSHDGFVLPQNRQTGTLVDCPFTNSPFPFFRELFSLRRKAQTFDNTPVGMLLGGFCMAEKDFEAAMQGGEIGED